MIMNGMPTDRDENYAWSIGHNASGYITLIARCEDAGRYSMPEHSLWVRVYENTMETLWESHRTHYGQADSTDTEELFWYEAIHRNLSTYCARFLCILHHYHGYDNLLQCSIIINKANHLSMRLYLRINSLNDEHFNKLQSTGNRNFLFNQHHI